MAFMNVSTPNMYNFISYKLMDNKLLWSPKKLADEDNQGGELGFTWTGPQLLVTIGGPLVVIITTGTELTSDDKTVFKFMANNSFYMVNVVDLTLQYHAYAYPENVDILKQICKCILERVINSPTSEVMQ